VKFARAGDVILSVARDYSTRATAGGLRIAVLDQGPTIPPADRERLFQPFSQLDRPDGDTAVGTGLGLSICLHLITMMGGAIGCEAWSDDQAGGNTFWITLPDTVIVLPLPAPAQAGPLPPRPDSAVNLPRRLTPRTRILLVEDVRANQVIAATLLRRVGHTVDIVSNGADAIRAVQRVPYDVVLMDIFMPGMSGQEATRHIRELPDLSARVPILALTANTAPEDEVLYIAAGMNGALGKPVSLPELQAALTRHVWPGHPAGGLTTLVPAVPAPDATESLLSLERLAELRMNLPADVLMNLVDACLTELDEKMPPFRRALAAGIASEIETQAHAIAGIAASYGLAAVETKARAIMAAAKGGEIVDFEAAFSDIEAALTRSGDALREIVQKSPT
jgi:CheY-like chemotaxis protein/HPt (histidine-containing phosphotransfer) domain-containing protein